MSYFVRHVYCSLVDLALESGLNAPGLVPVCANVDEFPEAYYHGWLEVGLVHGLFCCVTLWIC